MQNSVHPVLKALRNTCSQNLPLYEAICDLMQKEFLKKQSLDWFLEDLRGEREIFFTRGEAHALLRASGTDPALLEMIFKRAVKK